MADTRPQLSAANRRSYFREAPMEEYTPANSINEEAGRERRRGCLWRWVDGEGKVFLRMTNAMLHMGLCFVLFAIMVEFMVRYRGHRRRPQAIALAILVAVDSCLDIYSAIRLRKKWQGWVMALRLLLAMGYIVQFLIYVGFRKVFPQGYAFWGMTEGYSEPIVYLLLLLLGIWNLLHTAIHRHALGRDVRHCVTFVHARNARSNQVDDGSHSNQGPVPPGARQTTANTPARVGEVSDSNVTIALSEVHVKDKDHGVVIANQIGTSLTSGESASRGGSTAPTKSRTVSAATSRRTSATASDEETLDSHDLVENSVRARRQS